MADIEEKALAFLEKSIKQNKVFIDNFIFHYVVCRLSKGYCPCILFDS